MRRTLGTRIAVVMVLVVAVTALVAGLLATALVRDAALGQAHRQLARLADAAETRADRGDQRAELTRVRRVLRTLDVRVGTVDPAGHVITRDPVVRRVLTTDDRRALAKDQPVSGTRSVAGREVLLEARPTADGAIVLVRTRSGATAATDRALQRTLLALLVGVAVGVPASLLTARALARPLRRTARAAHALAGGCRDVRVPVEGPVEVADVAASLNSLAAALETSEGRQRTFLMSVSHDLRTPLTAIRGYAESMADGALDGPGGPDPDEVRRTGRVLTEETQRLERLVGDLLDLARLQADRFRVEPADTDVDGVVSATGQAWAERCRTAEVVLRVEAGAGVVVPTDAGRLRQVLDGLLENALRTAPPGSPLVLASYAEGDAAVVEVRDAGPGLTEDDQAHAFEPGVLHERYRGRRPSGTGLGLAISAGLVARLGGTITAGAAPEGGACFRVRLPRGRAPS